MINIYNWDATKIIRITDDLDEDNIRGDTPKLDFIEDIEE
jgi:hypothetical protein